MEEITDSIERVKHIIRLSGLNQKDFAERIGVTPPAISRLINGKLVLSNDMATNIANAFPELNISKYWILTGKEVTEPAFSDDLFSYSQNTTATSTSTTSPSASSPSTSATQSSAAALAVEQYFPVTPSKEAPSGRNKMGENKPLKNMANESAQVNKSKKEATEIGPHVEKIVVFYSDGTFREYRPRR